MIIRREIATLARLIIDCHAGLYIRDRCYAERVNELPRFRNVISLFIRLECQNYERGMKYEILKMK